MQKQNSKPLRLLLTVQADEKHYALGTLAFKADPHELFYHPAYPKASPKKQRNLNTGKTAQPLNHLSYHDNGHCHIRLRKKGNYLGAPWNFADGSFIPDNEQTISPLMIHTIYSNDYSAHLCSVQEVDTSSYQKKQQLVSLSNAQEFSMIFFLIPSSKNTDEVLSSMWVDFYENGQVDQFVGRMDLRALCNESFQPGRIKVAEWNGWDLLVVLSDLTIPVPESSLVPEDYFMAITVLDSRKPFEHLLSKRLAQA